MSDDSLAGERTRRALGYEPRRCGANPDGGEPCRRYPPPFGTRCNLHGGKSPQAMISADLRKRDFLKQLVPRAEAVIADKLEPRKPCAACGQGGFDKQALRAAFGLLDRVGLGPTDAVPGEGEGAVDLGSMSAADLRAKLTQMLAQLDEMDREEQLALAPAKDAILVDPPPMVGPPQGTDPEEPK